jgi:hypothetical protein
MRKLCPHEDLDTLADALCCAMGHLINTGVLDVPKEVCALIAIRTDAYNEEDLDGLFKAATQIIARSSRTH